MGLEENMQLSDNEENDETEQPALPNEKMEDDASSDQEQTHETGEYDIEEIPDEKDQENINPSNSTLPSDERQETDTNQEGFANTGGLGDEDGKTVPEQATSGQAS